MDNTVGRIVEMIAGENFDMYKAGANYGNGDSACAGLRSYVFNIALYGDRRRFLGGRKTRPDVATNTSASWYQKAPVW